MIILVTYSYAKGILKTILLISVLSFLTNVVFGQYKYEREYRIDESEVPVEALNFIAKTDIGQKVKWYKEEGFDNESLEAKTKFKGHKYSFEFDINGEIDDIEKEIKWKHIPKSVRKKISQFLDDQHDQVKHCKIQLQYTGAKKNLLLIPTNPDALESVELKYELVIKAKTDNEYNDYEYLFSDVGEMQKKSLIVSQNTDNLEY